MVQPFDKCPHALDQVPSAALESRDREEDLPAEFGRLMEQLEGLYQPEGQRPNEVMEEVARTGTYRHSAEELLAGAKVAWRNHARCNGRMHWRSLMVRDCREVATPAELVEECLEHLRVSTNGGALRAVLSVFPQADLEGKGFRVLNPQLVRYAGYRRADGSVTGDALHVDLTDLAVSLGWRSPGTEFDVLPLVVEDPRGNLTLWEVPSDYVQEVEITHPDYSGIGELGLRWHVNPAISDKMLAMGGLVYPLAPFSGWYVSSEIGARNLSDKNRYDKLADVAKAMGLNTTRDNSLWKDRAVVELTYAVQWSFEKAGVHIVDHHRAARQFLEHCEREAAQGRSTPTDWSWVNPPISASTTPTFHRTFPPPDFDVRPNFVARSEDAERCPASA